MTQYMRLSATLITSLFAAFAMQSTQAQTKAAAPAQSVTESNPAMVDAIFKAWDADKNGSLSQTEFKTGWNTMRQAMELQAALRNQFQTVDTDKNGYLDAKEYSGLMLVKKAGSAAPPFSDFDTNKDQRMEFPEYVGFVKRMTAVKPTAK